MGSVDAIPSLCYMVCSVSTLVTIPVILSCLLKASIDIYIALLKKLRETYLNLNLIFCKSLTWDNYAERTVSGYLVIS